MEKRPSKLQKLERNRSSQNNEVDDKMQAELPSDVQEVISKILLNPTHPTDSVFL